MDLRKTLDTFYYSAALCDLKLMNRKFVDESITYNSLLYIELIYTMGGTCTASKLAELLNVSKPGVTLKLNELIKQGLITKTTDEKDKRRNTLKVNEEAVPQYKVFRHQDSEAIKRLTERYSPEEIKLFCEMLDVISEINLEEINGD